MKTKKLSQVMMEIKQGEVWRTKTTRVYSNNAGELIIRDIDYFNNGDINILSNLVVINLDSEYWLEEN